MIEIGSVAVVIVDTLSPLFDPIDGDKEPFMDENDSRLLSNSIRASTNLLKLEDTVQIKVKV